MSEEFTKRSDATILKVSDRHGLVLGFAEVFSDENGEYFDTDGDARCEDAAIEAWCDFISKGQVLGDMHSKKDGGGVLFAFPLTRDIAKSLKIESPTLGVLVGIKPSAEGLEKYRSGEYTGFSIGGRRVEEEVVEA